MKTFRPIHNYLPLDVGGFLFRIQLGRSTCFAARIATYNKPESQVLDNWTLATLFFITS